MIIKFDNKKEEFIYWVERAKKFNLVNKQEFDRSMNEAKRVLSDIEKENEKSIQKGTKNIGFDNK